MKCDVMQCQGNVKVSTIPLKTLSVFLEFHMKNNLGIINKKAHKKLYKIRISEVFLLLLNYFSLNFYRGEEVFSQCYSAQIITILKIIKGNIDII